MTRPQVGVNERVQADGRPKLEGFLALLEMTSKFTVFSREVILRQDPGRE